MMQNPNRANLATFEALQNQAHAQMGLSSIGVFNDRSIENVEWTGTPKREHQLIVDRELDIIIKYEDEYLKDIKPLAQMARIREDQVKDLKKQLQEIEEDWAAIKREKNGIIQQSKDKLAMFKVKVTKTKLDEDTVPI